MDTTYSLYRSFLDGIRKGGSFSINIPQFNRLINDWGQDEWISKNVLYADLNQELIDKLAPLKVITDDEFVWSERIDKTNGYILKSIKTNDALGLDPKVKNYFRYPNMTNGEHVTIDGLKYPPYMRLQNVEFKVLYLNGNTCNFKGESEWKIADVLRADSEISNKNNPFRKPTESKFYYEFIGNSIKLIYNGKVDGYKMKMKYFKYPRRIFLNDRSTLSTDEQVGVPNYTGAVNGSINCELYYPQRKEIVNMAIRTFIERVQDQRYQSYLNELKIINNGKS
jgi:hypothetical protein